MVADFELARSLVQVDRTYVLHRGRKLVYFGGCDYLRLSSHPEVLAAVREGLDQFGLSVSASRMTTGNHPLYELVEKALASHFGFDRALLVPTGYQTNLVVAQALQKEDATILIDEKTHPSLRDAAVMMGGKIIEFAHRDAEDLKRQLRLTHGKIFVLTDGLFALSGEAAPLSEYAKIIGARGLLWVDDSHGSGLFEKGKGIVGHLALPRKHLILTTTLSKAFGSYGGAIICGNNIYPRLLNSRIMSGSTPIPLPLAAGALAALKLISRGSEWKRLRRNIDAFQDAVGNTRAIRSPIFSFQLPPAQSAQLKRRLNKAGIFPSEIRYGNQPPVFRFALSSMHSVEQVKSLAACLNFSTSA